MTDVNLPEKRARLSKADTAVLGARIREARVSAGLTQGAVAQGQLSVGYLSRIESGKRRPDLAMLEFISQRLDVALEQLLADETGIDTDLQVLEFAEIAMGLGDAQIAQEHLSTVNLARLGPADRCRVEMVRARAMEAAGDLNGAIEILERVEPTVSDSHHRLRFVIALSRCYRELGEFKSAIAAGEAGLARASSLGLEACDDSVQLSVTVAAAYFEQGDRDKAVRICRRSIDVAESLGSATSRASAYWNASVMSMEQGHVVDAVPLARRALDLLNEGSDDRNLAVLRTQVGTMELRLDPPQVTQAREHLTAAQVEMSMGPATHLLVLRSRIGLARCDLIDGSIDSARAESEALLSDVQGSSPLMEAEVLLLAAQVAGSLGEVESVRHHLLSAVHCLLAAGNDRAAADLWMDLGAFLESVEEWSAAKDAYRAAAVASGLHPRSVPVAPGIAIHTR